VGVLGRRWNRNVVGAAIALTAAMLTGPSLARAAEPGGAKAAVTVTPNGWIHFNAPVAAAVPLEAQQTEVVTGTAVTGGCSFEASETVPAETPGIFEEETAYDPTTCEESVLRGTLSQAGIEQLEAELPGSEPASADTESKEAKLKLKTSSSGATPAATSFASAHGTTLYVDPLQIVITGYTTDISWPLHGAVGNIGAQAFAHQFEFDEWKAKKPTKPVLSAVSGGWAAEAHVDAFNSEFQHILEIASPKLDLILCEHRGEEAHFHQDIAVYGYSNDTETYVSHDTATGACSNLVRHVGWSDFGWSETFPKSLLKYNPIIAETETGQGGERSEIANGAPGKSSPSVAALPNGNFELAAQSNAGGLWTITGTPGATSWTGREMDFGMASGTSPSVAALPNGNFELAAQSNAGGLWTITGTPGATSWTGREMDFGMAPGTSPSVAALPNGNFVLAAQSNKGGLWTITGAPGATTWTGREMDFGMAAGTSPSIVALPNGNFELAAQSNAGGLWTITGTPGATSWTGREMDFGMAPRTSPSVAALPNGNFELAAQSNKGGLWTITGTPGATSWTGREMDFGMEPGTSPSVAALPNGNFELAQQSNATGLWTITGTPGATSWTGREMQFGMAPATSPSVAALPNGNFELAQQSNVGGLWTITGTPGATSWTGREMQFGMG
jgi:hypothetical protein